MKKALGTIVVLLIVVVLGIVGFASTRPNEFTITRAADLAAPPSSVYMLVNDFSRWPEWSPWEKLDPALKRTISQPSGGVGASYAWVGNDQVGEGKMTILESVPDSRVAIRLEFIKPFASVCQSVIAIEPSGEGSHVTWTMTGQNNLMSKVMGLFMNMDQMVGKDFETGLPTVGARGGRAPAPADTSSASTN
jgi:uncharacterized protein YndB with AHSA1/START domain